MKRFLIALLNAVCLYFGALFATAAIVSALVEGPGDGELMFAFLFVFPLLVLCTGLVIFGSLKSSYWRRKIAYSNAGLFALGGVFVVLASIPIENDYVQTFLDSPPMHQSTEAESSSINIDGEWQLDFNPGFPHRAFIYLKNSGGVISGDGIDAGLERVPLGGRVAQREIRFYVSPMSNSLSQSKPILFSAIFENDRQLRGDWKIRMEKGLFSYWIEGQWTALRITHGSDRTVNLDQSTEIQLDLTADENALLEHFLSEQKADRSAICCTAGPPQQNTTSGNVLVTKKAADWLEFSCCSEICSSLQEKIGNALYQDKFYPASPEIEDLA